MNFTKIFGWILLIAGVAIIVFALYSSYNIFTGKAEAPRVFKVEEKIEIPIPTGKAPATPTELQKELEKMISEQLKEIIPVEFLPRLLNLITWSIFAGILIFAGAQISSLGIKLIKK